MKTFLNFRFWAVIMMAAVLFAACNQEDLDYIDGL
jgi:hypothetical protein